MQVFFPFSHLQTQKIMIKIKLGDMLELPNVKDEIANGKQVTVGKQDNRRHNCYGLVSFQTEQERHHCRQSLTTQRENSDMEKIKMVTPP